MVSFELMEEKAIKQVIERAYIEGIHTTQDENTVRSGFHKDFAMLVLQDNATFDQGWCSNTNLFGSWRRIEHGSPHRLGSLDAQQLQSAEKEPGQVDRPRLYFARKDGNSGS